MFIVDFDDTLLDTQAYKEMRIVALEGIGITPELYHETYKQTRQGYTHERHAALLAERGFDYDQVLKTLEDCLAKVGQFVFPDAVKFLQFLQSKKQPVVLLSIGLPNLQEQKLRLSKLHNYFDRVFIVPEAKETILAELQPVAKGNWWLFNDRIEQTLELKQLFPDLRAVLKRADHSPVSAYQASGLPHFATLIEIQKYVDQQL